MSKLLFAALVASRSVTTPSGQKGVRRMKVRIFPRESGVHWDGAGSWVSPVAYSAFPSVLHLPGGIVLFSGRISAV